MNKAKPLARISRIAGVEARRHGVLSAAYAHAGGLDVLTESRSEKAYGYQAWAKVGMADVYLRPCIAARSIRRQIKQAWAAR